MDKKTKDRIRARPPMDAFPFECPCDASSKLREEFHYFQTLLAPRGIWTEGDVDGILALCEAKIAVADLRAIIRDEGWTYWTTTTSGNRVLKANPASTLLDKEIRRLDNYLYEYGLTPLGRVKLGISLDGGGPLDELQSDDPVDEFFPD